MTWPETSAGGSTARIAAAIPVTTSRRLARWGAGLLRRAATGEEAGRGSTSGERPPPPSPPAGRSEQERGAGQGERDEPDPQMGRREGVFRQDEGARDRLPRGPAGDEIEHASECPYERCRPLIEGRERRRRSASSARGGQQQRGGHCRLCEADRQRDSRGAACPTVPRPARRAGGDDQQRERDRGGAGLLVEERNGQGDHGDDRQLRAPEPRGTGAVAHDRQGEPKPQGRADKRSDRRCEEHRLMVGRDHQEHQGRGRGRGRGTRHADDEPVQQEHDQSVERGAEGMDQPVALPEVRLDRVDRGHVGGPPEVRVVAEWLKGRDPPGDGVAEIRRIVVGGLSDGTSEGQRGKQPQHDRERPASRSTRPGRVEDGFRGAHRSDSTAEATASAMTT